MSLGSFLGRVGGSFSNAPPEAWFGLAQALTSTKRPGQGLALGLSQFGQSIQENKRKASLAEAMKGAIGGLSPEQAAFLQSMEPEQASGILAQKMFGGGGKSWEAKDLDNDGRPDVQIDSSTGKIEAYPLNVKERAYNMMFEAGVSPVAPGIGVDRRGQIVPMGDQQQPQMRPTMAPDAAPAPVSSGMAQMLDDSAALAPPPAKVTAEPTGTPAPAEAPIPLQGDALARMKLPQPDQGKQWALDRKTWLPVQVPAPGAAQVGGEEAKAIRQQINTTMPNMRNALDQYEKALDSTTWIDRTMGPFGGAPMARLKTLHTNTLMLAKELFNLGVLNGPDYQLMLQMVDDPESWTATARGMSGLKEQLKAFREILDKNVDTWKARAEESGVSGIVPGAGGSKRIKYDASGNRVQ